jgi:hypothetical protein
MSNYYNKQWRFANNENKDKQSNYSMDFDGTNKTIATSYYWPTGNTAKSISLWFYKDSGDATLIGGGQSSSGKYFGISSFSYNSRFKFDIYPSINFSNNSAAIGQWQHVVVTAEPSGNDTILNGYVDGVLDSNFPHSVANGTPANLTTVAGGINTGSTAPVTIGENNVLNYNKFPNGKIDGVAIFDYTLSQSQVTTLYGSSSTGIGNPMSLSPKPVAYYPLGDQDAFNGSNYLVPNSSLKDYVFSFDANSSINCGTISTLTSSTNFSISGWFNQTTVDQTGFMLGARSSSTDAVFLYTYSDGNMYVDVSNSSQSYGYFDYSTVVSANTWFHVAMVFNGTGSANADKLKLYINGSPITLTYYNTIPSSTTSSTNDFKIGVVDGYTNEWNGAISNVQIFNTALSATGSNSVETLYNNGSPLTSMTGFSSLQGWWKLDASATYDGSNWSIPDDSSNSNDGTSSGMTQANLVQSDLSFKTSISPFALDFDGTSLIYATNPVPLSTASSVSCWFKYRDTATKAYLWTAGSGNGKPSLTGLVDDSKTLKIAGDLGAGGYSMTNHTVGEWLHSVLVYDGTNSILYVNGAQVLTTTAITNNLTASQNINIGAWNRYGNSSYTSYAYDSALSNLSVWNASLTSSQVTEIYSEGVPSNLNNHSAYSNLVSWWQLGSNSSFNTNWTVLDEKGSNNGVSSNMTEADIVDGVGSYANGLSSGMGGDEVIGDAPYSTANALSVNMDVEDRVSDTPS